MTNINLIENKAVSRSSGGQSFARYLAVLCKAGARDPIGSHKIQLNTNIHILVFKSIKFTPPIWFGLYMGLQNHFSKTIYQNIRKRFKFIRYN